MKLRPLLTVLLTATSLPFFAGCSTLMNLRAPGTKVTAEPAGASAAVDGSRAAATPLKVQLMPNKSHTVFASKDGFDRAAVVLFPATTDNPSPRQYQWGRGQDLAEVTDVPSLRVQFSLKPVLPAGDRPEAFSELLTRVKQADELKKQGKVSADERNYLVKQIEKFYSMTK